MVTQVREEVKRREKAIMQRLMASERELLLRPATKAMYGKRTRKGRHASGSSASL
jgi:hypothetical protein